MRNSGAWKKFSMYKPDDANFVLLKCSDPNCPLVAPLDEKTFDTLKLTIQPVVQIPDDVFLFCGDIASQMLTDIQNLVRFVSKLDAFKQVALSFYSKARASQLDAAAVT